MMSLLWYVKGDVTISNAIGCKLRITIFEPVVRHCPRVDNDGQSLNHPRVKTLQSKEFTKCLRMRASSKPQKSAMTLSKANCSLQALELWLICTMVPSNFGRSY